MTSAGRYLTTSNGLTDWYPDSVGVPEGSIGIADNTADEMIDEVRHQVKNGVDFIKLADSPFGDYQSFTEEELKAHRRPRPPARQADAPSTPAARAEVDAAVAAGFDWIMHGNIMTDETIGAPGRVGDPARARRCCCSRTGRCTGRPPGRPKPMCDGMPAHARAHARRASTGRTRPGVKFVLGTDSGFAITPYGEWHARELELLMNYAGVSGSRPSARRPSTRAWC